MFLLFNGCLYNMSTVAKIYRIVAQDTTIPKPYGITLLTAQEEVSEYYSSLVACNNRFERISSEVGASTGRGGCG